MNASSPENQLVFTQGQHAIEVHLHGQTLWLTQLQMAQVFDTSVDNVSLHLKIYFRTRSWMKSQLPRISR